MKPPGVVHLVRAANGIAPFHQFLASYRAHPAGCDHELVLLCKGFTPHQFMPYRDLLDGVAYRTLDVPDRGFDIGSYLYAARHLDYPSFCFLNSWSEILADNWLQLLQTHLAQPAVGLVGASGSWESTYTNVLQTMHQRWHENLAVRMRWVLLVARYRRLFPPFPNIHLRTNAFLIDAAMLRQLHFWPIRSKRDAQRFESGWQGITRQVQARGYVVRVVGRDGAAYAPDAWPQSDTFRTGEQVNLLVADNRTRDYAQASLDQQYLLTTFVWGKRQTSYFTSQPHEVSE